LESPTSWPMVKFKKPRHTVKSYRFQTKGHHRNALMMAHMIIATAATRHGLNLLHFDSESVPIRINNCCSKCITNDVKDLIPSTIKATTKVVRGFKGEECAATCRGTLQWTWDDNMGVETVFLIPNSYLVPEAVSKLLCPQHWA